MELWLDLSYFCSIAMRVTTFKSQGILQTVVREFWYADMRELAAQTRQYRIVANGAPGLIFQHQNGRSGVSGGNGILLPVSFIYGQSTQVCINSIHPDTFIFGVNFQPTAFKGMFATDSCELTDVALDVNLLFGAQWTDRLLGVSSPQQLVELFSTQLYQRLNQGKTQHHIERGTRLLQGFSIEESSGVMAAKQQLSLRQFQRLFKSYVGVSPDAYRRILRFQKSIRTLQLGNFEKLSEVAYELGYADQSHFIKSFKQFSGYSPNDFVRATAQIGLSKSEIYQPLRIIEDIA